MRRVTLLALLAVLAAPAHALADVWTVDTGGPFADFDDLQTAIDAAADGDTLVIRKQCCPPPAADWFPDVLIEGRSLTLVAEGTTPLLTFLEIRDTPASGAVVLRGFQAQGTRIDGNDGVVWLEDCSLSGNGNVAPIAALRATENAALVIQDSSLVGLDGFWGNLLFGWPAAQESSSLEVVDTDLYLEGCTLAGGRGKDSYVQDPLQPEVVSPTTAGVAALRMQGGSLWMSGCVVSGGAGGDVGPAPSTHPCLFSGGDGAAAVQLDGTAARVVDSLVLGGAGGLGWPSPCAVPPFMAQPGVPGVAWELVSSTLSQLPGVAVGLTSASPLYEGGPALVTVSGEPGQLALVLLSLDLAAPGAIPQAFGALYPGVAPQLLIRILGRIGGDGTAALAATLGDLPPGVDGLQLVLQGAACQLGACGTGGASVVSILDASL